jgi:ATP synthase assembly factor FMC1, mitochondrial
MSNAAQLRSLYRSLLRELPPRPLPSATQARSPLHTRLRETFATAHDGEHTAVQAAQLVQYLRAQRQYTTLIERYNPGMNMDEEERVRLTARRVGMDLPVEYDSKTEKKD